MAFSPSSPGGGSFPGRQSPRGLVSQNNDEHRINERIRVPQVRLIDEHGNQLGIVPTSQALQIARDKGLDLMEVAPNADPPVCKICDYGKFKYEKKKKEQEAKKKQTVIKVKEIQLRPNTDVHDLEYKTKNVREFLEEGDKAKITMMFRGRQVMYAEQGLKIMKELAEKMSDIAVLESSPKLEGKKMTMILAPTPATLKAATKRQMERVAAKNAKPENEA
jgi:translation initiation factor IF-3